MAERRRPSAQELRQEGVIRRGLIVDAGILVALLVTAFWSTALSVGAECLRGLVMWVLSLTSLLVLTRINRGRLVGYDFGTGKLEQVIKLLVAVTMGAGAVALFVGIHDRWVAPLTTTGAGMWAGFATVLINFAVNTWFFVGITRASRGKVSPVVEAERHSWFIKLIASGVVVVGVGISAAFRNHSIGNTADLLGTAVVAVFMVWISTAMIRDALPDLLDKALNEDLQLTITRVLADHFESYDRLGTVRSRRTGTHMIVEIELGFAAPLAIGIIEQRLARIKDDLEENLAGCGIILIPRAAS